MFIKFNNLSVNCIDNIEIADMVNRLKPWSGSREDLTQMVWVFCTNRSALNS